MYFVDRNVLEHRLAYMQELLSFLDQRSTIPQVNVEQLAVERAIHLLIETILDVGNQMIDGFIMRDPGSYEDIIEILMDEQVLTKHQGGQLISFILLRKELVSRYWQVDHTHLWLTFSSSRQALEQFPSNVRSYLEEHLGPVSAFLPNQ